MTMLPGLVCELFSASPLDPQRYAEPLFAILDDWRYRPSKYGDSEPLRNKWGDPRAFYETCRACASMYFGPVIVSWNKPRFGLMITHESGPKVKSHSLSIFSCEPKHFGGNGAPYLLELADALFDTMGFTYGFACLNSEYYSNNIVPATYLDGATVRPQRVVGMEWPDCIPGFYWCNYFGDAYLSEGLSSALLGLPNTTPLARGMRVLRSASALDWDLPEERARSAELVAACGPDWFFSKRSGMPAKALRTNNDAFRSPMTP
jgi:hypothetical protein